MASSAQSFVERTIAVDGVAMVRLLGPGDRLLKMVEREHPRVRVLVRSNEIHLSGEEHDVARAERLITELVDMTCKGIDLDPSAVGFSQELLDSDGSRPSEVLGEAIVASRGKVVRPKTQGQKAYVEAIDEHTIVFGIGPAGTGKTYLAMAKAVQALQRLSLIHI